MTGSGDLLTRMGVADTPAATRPFDPGYDPATVEAHLVQSGHLMAFFKLSVGWLLASEEAVRRKVAAAQAQDVPIVTGGGPFEIAASQDQLEPYLDVCADLGVSRVECGEGFTELGIEPDAVVQMCGERGLEVEFELGKKHGGPFTSEIMRGLLGQGREWLAAGARQLVIEARESARGVGLFDLDGNFNAVFAERFVEEFGLETVVFEAPTKPSQFAILDHFGSRVQLSNVRLEEVLRVEAYRRGLHSDAYTKGQLGPRSPSGASSKRS